MTLFEIVSLAIALALLVATAVALVDLFFGDRIDGLVKRWMDGK